MSSTQVDASEVAARPVKGVSARAGDAVVAAGSERAAGPAVTGPVLLALAGLVPATTAAGLVGARVGALAALAAWGTVSVVRAVAGRRTAVRDRLRADVKATVVLSMLTAFAAIGNAMPIHQARLGVALVVVAGCTTMVLRLLKPAPAAARRVVLVGGQQELETYVAAATAGAAGDSGDVVAGCYVVDAGAATAVQPGLLVPTTTSVDTLPDLVGDVRADAVLVLPGAGVTPELVRHLSWQFEHSGVSVGVVCPVSSVSAHRLVTSVSGAGTVLEVGVPRATIAARVGKAVLDRVGAAVLLTLTGPLLALLWLAVKLDSAGPGFFVQTRVGLDGRPFRMVKLRTMHRNAEAMLTALAQENESDGVLFKIRRDPRITRVGSWLRRSSLDELPQLFNVLRGDMSLVGPRPALPEEVATYDEVARRRLVVKPGITGLWQVSGRSDLLWEESLRLDLYYADNWRLVDDVTIAFRTVAAVTQARGAY